METNKKDFEELSVPKIILLYKEGKINATQMVNLTWRLLELISSTKNSFAIEISKTEEEDEEKTDKSQGRQSSGIEAAKGMDLPHTNH